MGNPLFGIDISGLINEHVGPGVLDATLTVVTPGTVSPSDYTAGTNPTSTSYAGKGFIDSKRLSSPGAEIIDDGSVFIVLIGDSFAAVPRTGDKITIEGTTYRIEDLDRDPAAATYTCKSKAI